MNMFPLEFDKFLERGISTIDASVKELQNTYEEVVWGGAPQPTSNTSTPPLRRRNNNNGSSVKQQEILRRSRSGPELSPELLARREDALRSRSRSSSGKQTKTGLHVSAKATTTKTPTKSTPRGGVKSPSCSTNNTHTNALTPTTEVDDSSWGDSSSSDGDDTSYGDTTSGFYSTERDNDSSLMESLTTNSKRAASNSNSNTNTTSKTRSNRNITPVMYPPSYSPTAAATTAATTSGARGGPSSTPIQRNPSSTDTNKNKKNNSGSNNNIKNSNQHKNNNSGDNIDELFGYNTKQRITKTKSHVGEHVGLDFMVLDTPAKSGGRKSLLIVSAIDSQHGLFAYTSLNVGDAILEINGISFSSNGGYGSLRPSVYRARKLLSGNDSGLEVTIIYQKFGETNNTSMASESTIGLSQMMYDEVEEEKKEEEQQEQQAHGNSTSSGRRSQNNSRTITSKKGVSSPQGPSSSEHSRSERTATTRSMSTRSGSYSGRPQRNIRKAAAAAINAASTTISTTNNSSGAAAGGANRPPLPSSPRSKAPTTKISRLTRLRARTQKLRETGVKTIEASKKRLSFVSSSNNNNNNSTKNNKQISNKEKKTPTTTTTTKTSTSRAAVVTAASKLEKKLKKSSSSLDRRHGDNNDHSTKDGISTSNHNIYDVVGTRSTLPHNIIEACAVGVCAPISPEDSILNLSDDPSIISSSSSIHLNPGIALSSAGDVLYKEQLQWLKQKMKARGSLPPSSTIDHNDIFRGVRTTSPSAVPTTTTTAERDTKTTHSQQQQNPQLLSPVNNKNNINNEKNAIFDDNSICTIEQYESIVQRYDGGSGGGDITADNHQKELVRINRKVFDKLHGRIDRLKRSNIQLSDQIVSLRRENNKSSAKLSEVQSRSEKICKRERGYQSEIQLLRSRYEMSIIQADKRQKELITSKEIAQKENDKVISDYLEQIESLESANQGQLQIADKERQEKYKVLYSQLERLETKFSAQSTLLDTVMTANEELTTQNEEMEVEYQKHYHSNSNGSAVEIANCKSRNIYLEKRVANLESQLGLQEGRLLNQESIGISIISEDHSGNNKSSNSNPSDEEMIADQNYVSASTDDSFVEVFVGGNRISGQQLRYPQRLLRGEPANDNNGCETGTEILLKYPNNGELFDNSIIEEVEDNDDNNTDSIVKGNTVSFESVSSRLLMERIDRIKGNNESFESVSSQVLMERMVELENALQDRDMTEEERAGFVSTLQARVQRLIERGYGEYHVSD